MNLAEVEAEARVALLTGRDERARQLLERVVAIDPQRASSLYLLSLIAHQHHDYEQEEKVLMRAVRLEPQNVTFQCHLARALTLSGNTALAKQTLDGLASSTITEPALADAVASAFNRLNLYESACDWYEKLIALDNRNPYAWFNLGTCYKYVGRFDEAELAFEQALERKPDYEKALAALSSLKPLGTASRIARLETQIARKTNPDSRLHLAHALSREQEAAGDYQSAFRTLVAAKQQKREALGATLATVADNVRYLSQTDLDVLPRTAKPEQIFIVGMPRSGTTLVERILSAAPGIVSGGELYHFSAGLKKAIKDRTSRFVPSRLPAAEELLETGRRYRESTAYFCSSNVMLLDKLPLNALLVRQILFSLKNAVIVCLDRHPLDTIVGNFRQLFSFEDGAHHYSLSLSETAHFYSEFRQAMNVIATAFPDRFHRINYENLVRNPVEEGQALFKFLGLVWDERVLNIQDNNTPVATASSVQVRQAINTRSIGQWRRYEPLLEEAKHVLSERGIPFQ